MRTIRLLPCALAVTLAVPAERAVAQKPGDTGFLTWPDVQAKVDAHWRATYPTEHVVSIDPKGNVEYASTERITETDWWWSWTHEIGGSFARQAALVLVERANKSRARFEVAALYRGVNKKFVFDKIVIGPVVEMDGPPGAPPPPTVTVAIGLFYDAWVKERSDFKVNSVSLDAPPTINHSGPRYWINYKLVIDAAGTDKGPKAFANHHIKCAPADYSSVLKWDAAKSAWVVDDSAVRNVNETSACEVIP